LIKGSTLEKINLRINPLSRKGLDILKESFMKQENLKEINLSGIINNLKESH
jgi:hypothetical protein